MSQPPFQKPSGQRRLSSPSYVQRLEMGVQVKDLSQQTLGCRLDQNLLERTDSDNTKHFGYDSPPHVALDLIIPDHRYPFQEPSELHHISRSP